MPILIHHLPPQTVATRAILNPEETAVAQGLEGQQLRKEIENVSRHWREQSLGASEIRSSEMLDRLSQYQHPSFENVGKVRIRFARTTDLQPRKFVFDEEDE